MRWACRMRIRAGEGSTPPRSTNVLASEMQVHAEGSTPQRASVAHTQADGQGICRTRGSGIEEQFHTLKQPPGGKGHSAQPASAFTLSGEHAKRHRRTANFLDYGQAPSEVGHDILSFASGENAHGRLGCPAFSATQPSGRMPMLERTSFIKGALYSRALAAPSCRISSIFRGASRRAS